MAEQKKTTTTKTTTTKKATPAKPAAKTTPKKAEPTKKAAPKKLTKEQEKVFGKGGGEVATATAKNVGVAPRKVRLVLDLIRNKDCNEALAILMFTRRAASGHIAKVVKSAIANATHNLSLQEDKLYVSACYANEGLVMKRTLPRARGSADIMRKRTSHITVCVKERE